MDMSSILKHSHPLFELMGDVAYFMTKKLILKESIFFISIIIFYQEQSFFCRAIVEL